MIINWYMNGDHYIGPHSDNEKGLVSNSSIYSITLGPDCVREFIIENKKTSKTSKTSSSSFKDTIKLRHHDVLIMGGTMQKHYKHSIPKSKRVQGPRINITFRLTMPV